MFWIYLLFWLSWNGINYFILYILDLDIGPFFKNVWIFKVNIRHYINLITLSLYGSFKGCLKHPQSSNNQNQFKVNSPGRGFRLCLTWTSFVLQWCIKTLSDRYFLSLRTLFYFFQNRPLTPRRPIIPRSTVVMIWYYSMVK